TRRQGQALYIGYHFSARHQGVGYATEAVAGLIAQLRESQRRAIRLKVHPDNARSLRLAAKLGFQPAPGRRGAPDAVELILPREAVRGLSAPPPQSPRRPLRLKSHPDNARSLRPAAKLGFQPAPGRRGAPDEVELILPREAELPAFP